MKRDSTLPIERSLVYAKEIIHNNILSKFKGPHNFRLKNKQKLIHTGGEFGMN